MKGHLFSQGKVRFLLFVVLALSLRCLYFSQTRTFLQPGVGSDGHFYVQWAKEIVRGKVLGSAVFYALPGYPYFLSLLYLFSGGDISALILLQIFLGSVNCGLIYILGRRLFQEQVGVISAIIACGYFMFIFYERMLLPTTVAIFLGLVLLLLLLDKRTSLCRWFGKGAFLGLCALTRASFSLLAVFILFWIAWEYKREAFRRVFLYCLSFTLPFLLIIGLVAWRNYLVSGETVLVSAHSGINFYIGNNPQANGLLKAPLYMRPTQSGLIEDAKIVAERLSARTLSASEASRFWFRRAFSFIRTQPLGYLRLLLRKAVLFLNGEEYVDEIEYYIVSEEVNPAKLPFFRLAFVLPLAILGMMLAWGQRKKVALAYLFVLSLSLGVIFFFVNSRYRVIVLPYLIIFSAYAARHILMLLETKRYKALALALALFFSLYFLTNIKVSGATAKLDFTVHYNKGVRLIDQKDYSAAEKELDRALSLNPRDFMSYFAIGNLYYHTQQFSRAADNYKICLAINPYFYEAHFNLGLTYEHSGRRQDTEDEFKAAIELCPQYYPAHYNLGRIYQEKGMPDLALKEYQKALETAPGHPQILQAIEEVSEQFSK